MDALSMLPTKVRGVPNSHIYSQRNPVSWQTSPTNKHSPLSAPVWNKSREIGVKMNIAVVDVGANLKAFIRMDGAWLGSIDIAIKKARTSRLFDMESGDVGKLSQPGGELFNIEVSNSGLITFPGGIPIKSANGEVIGAVGVSGSTVANDFAVAKAAAAAAE